MAKAKTPVDGEVKEIKRRKRTPKNTKIETPVETSVVVEEQKAETPSEPVKKTRKSRTKKVVEVDEAPAIFTEKVEEIVAETPVITMAEVDKQIPYSISESKHVKHTQKIEAKEEEIKVPTYICGVKLNDNLRRMLNKFLN